MKNSTPRGAAIIMIATPKPGDDAGASMSSDSDGCEICVKADAFKIDGTAPEPGDEVSFSGKGKITRVEGDEVYFNVTDVNGQKPMEDDDNDADENDDGEFGSIMDAAKKADEGGGATS